MTFIYHDLHFSIDSGVLLSLGTLLSGAFGLIHHRKARRR